MSYDIVYSSNCIGIGAAVSIIQEMPLVRPGVASQFACHRRGQRVSGPLGDPELRGIAVGCIRFTPVV
jgi:hypothetical protein